MTDENETDVVRWYTRARKFPQLIGRTPDGMKLPGGPYTITQAVAAGVILVVGLNTMDIWARFGFIGNALTLALVTGGSVWGLGRIPVGSRNPISVLTGASNALFAPAVGRIGGRPVRIRRPHQVRHSIVVARHLASGLAREHDHTPAPATEQQQQPQQHRLLNLHIPSETAPAASSAAGRVPLAGISAALAYPTSTPTDPTSSMETNR